MNGDDTSSSGFGWGDLTKLVSGLGQAVGSAASGFRGNVADLTRQANGNAAPTGSTNWTPWLIGAGIIAFGLVLLGVLRKG